MAIYVFRPESIYTSKPKYKIIELVQVQFKLQPLF